MLQPSQAKPITQEIECAHGSTHTDPNKLRCFLGILKMNAGGSETQ